jgi:DNA gyrase subunit A
MVTAKFDYGFVRPTQIEAEMRSSYLDYAMSVIVARALPDARDGLKPVQRRILYAMQGLGMRPNSSYKKSARLVGEVLGKYHPHGDQSVYDAMVRMAQPWSMRAQLVDGQGNFGSVDDDPAAAMRYTEARLTALAEEMLVNLDEETVDFVDNFDGTLREPVVMPARVPNLMVNGASGIAVGMATNIPPHNLSEICSAIVHLINHPDATPEQLMRHVPGPDFPTGGTIMGREGIRSAYLTGKGPIVVRARALIEPMKRSNRMHIIVTELPFQVNKASLVEKIASLTKDRRLEGISEIRDESDRKGMRVVIELRGGTQPQVVLNNLYKLTSMQNSFSANMLALVDGTPRVITLKNALQHFIEFRQEVVTRRSEYELKRAKERAHILAGLRIAIGHLDEVIALIRASADAEAARNGLMERFGLDEKQAQAILDMQLRRIAALERERLEKEYNEIQETIKGLEELLADPEKVMAEVKKETQQIKRKFGEERRTDITDDAYDFSRADLEAHEQVVITLSQAGYIKRIPAATYRNQHRGGKGVISMNTKDNDPVRHILVADTHDRILFFTDTGRVLAKTSYELRADTSRNTRGVPVVNVLPIVDTEKIKALFEVASLEQEDTFLVMATRKGRINRVRLSEIANIRPSGLIMMNMRDDDELVTVRLAKEDEDVIIVSEQGMSIRFGVGEIPQRNRGAMGVKGMGLRDDDNVVSMGVGGPESRLLVISKLGFGKLTPLNKYRRQGRAGIGIKTFNITKKTGRVAAAEIVDDSKEVYVVSEQAQVLRTNLSEIRSIGRITQGVTIFKPQAGDTVSSIACVSALEKSDDSSEEVETPPAKPSTNGQTNGKANGQMSLDDIK